MLVDTTGEIISSFSPKAWADYVNELVEEKAYIETQQKLSPQEEALWLAQKVKEIKEGRLVIVIEVREGEIAGMCEVRRGSMAREHNVHFGLSVRPRYRRQGIGENLLRKGIEIAQHHFHAQNIWIEVVEGNEPAFALYKKLGFKEVARLPAFINYYGQLKDLLILKWGAIPNC